MMAQSFLGGTVVLVAAGIVTKALGALFTIPLARLIGAEGVGLLSMASPVFSTTLVLCASGIPVATSKLVAERLSTGDGAGARQVLLAALSLMLPVGLFLSLALHGSARSIATFLVKDPRAFLPLTYLAPAIAVVSVSAVLRGYFQGHRTMVPTAASHVLEQIVRVTVGLGLAYALLPRGVQWAAAGSAVGTFAGALAGLALLVAFLLATERRRVAGGSSRPRRRRLPGPRTPAVTMAETGRKLLALAGPVTLAAFVGPLLEATCAVIVPARLQHAGFSVAKSTELYGHLSVMALGLVVLPGVVAVAIATSLVPQVAAAYAARDRRRTRALARQAVRGALLLGVPASAGLAALPTQICALLFADAAGGVPLSVMAFGSVFFCLQQTTAGVLNGMGKVHVPALNGLAAVALTATTAFVLTGMPDVGVRGAALGIALGFLLGGMLNALAVGAVTGDGVRIFKVAWRAVVGSCLMMPAVAAVYRGLSACAFGNAASTAAGVLAGAMVYACALTLLGEFSPRELAIVPVIGPSIARLLRGGPIPRA